MRRGCRKLIYSFETKTKFFNEFKARGGGNKQTVLTALQYKFLDALGFLGYKVQYREVC